jgi:hypothetical protein
VKAGFAKADITPRVGVELCGFGPFIQRRSVGVRDRLWARAVAIEHKGRTWVLVSCDLIGLTQPDVRRIKYVVGEATGLRAEAILTHCTHTHSGPCTAPYNGWGERDLPYCEVLPGRAAKACIEAVEALREVTVAHAEVMCEGIAINREYEKRHIDPQDVLDDRWRPEQPELTDTTCHVITFRGTDGALVGFLSYFGCHPVVCCEETRYIHGDFVGVATNLIEAENPGSTGLFLQGAQGDVNTAFAHRPEEESLAALDVFAERYARCVRAGIAEAQPVEVDEIASASRMADFSRKDVTVKDLRRLLAEDEAITHAFDADPESIEVRMATVRAVALRKHIERAEAGEPAGAPVEVQGLRLGPISLLGAPLEIFQAIKNDVRQGARSPVTLVLGLTNGDIGYAPDRNVSAKGGYAVDTVPLIVGELPFRDIHGELVRELLEVEKGLF